MLIVNMTKEERQKYVAYFYNRISNERLNFMLDTILEKGLIEAKDRKKLYFFINRIPETIEYDIQTVGNSKNIFHSCIFSKIGDDRTGVVFSVVTKSLFYILGMEFDDFLYGEFSENERMMNEIVMDIVRKRPYMITEMKKR